MRPCSVPSNSFARLVPAATNRYVIEVTTLPAAASQSQPDALLEYEQVPALNCGEFDALFAEHGPVVDSPKSLTSVKTSEDESTSPSLACKVASLHTCPRPLQAAVQEPATPPTTHAPRAPRCSTASTRTRTGRCRGILSSSGERKMAEQGARKCRPWFAPRARPPTTTFLVLTKHATREHASQRGGETVHAHACRSDLDCSHTLAKSHLQVRRRCSSLSRQRCGVSRSRPAGRRRRTAGPHASRSGIATHRALTTHAGSAATTTNPREFSNFFRARQRAGSSQSWPLACSGSCTPSSTMRTLVAAAAGRGGHGLVVTRAVRQARRVRRRGRHS